MPLAGVDFQVEIDLGAVVELTDGFCIALSALVLGIDLVIDSGRESGEAVSPVGSNDVGLDGASAGISEIDDGVRERVILMIKNLAKQQPADGLILLVERCARERKSDDQK